MGTGISKQSTNKGTASRYYDSIAVHYILTQNFQDLTSLTSAKGCDKLVVLTEKVLNKFLNTKEIEYLEERRKHGSVSNNKKKEKIAYFYPPKGNGQDSEKNITGYSYTNDDGSKGVVLPTDDNNIRLNTSKKKQYDLDAKGENKKRICKGIAKFYVRIAHVYAAMMKSVNPVFKYKTPETGDVWHKKSLLNRKKIPKNAKEVTITDINLCNRRINSLTTPQDNPDKITVGFDCNVNKKWKTEKFSHTQSISDEELGSITVTSKKLGEEPGIKDLFDLYKNKYNKLTGEWYIGKDGYNKLLKDTKTFYKAFTGKSDEDYKKWNPNKNNKEEMKTFKDIDLLDFHNKSECKTDGEGWRRKYTDDVTKPLFAKYAENLKKMLKNAEDRQQKILKHLDEIFEWYDKDDNHNVNIPLTSENKYLGLKKDLNEEKLDKIIINVRNDLVEIYLGCENEYKNNLKIFQAIVAKYTFESRVEKEKKTDSIDLGIERDDSTKVVIDEAMKKTVEKIADNATL